MNDDMLSHDTLQIIHEQFTRIKLLTSDLHIKDQTIGILQEKLQEMDNELIHAHQAKEQVERQLGILQEEHNAMFETQSKKAKSLQAFNQQILVALKEVQDKNQQLLDRVRTQEQEIQQQQAGKIEIHQQLSLLKQGVADIEKDLSAAQKRNSQLKKEKAELLETVKMLGMQVDETGQRDEEVKNLIASCETENQTLNNELQTAKKTLDQQYQELIELRFMKKNYEELHRKHEELATNFQLQQTSSKKSEQVYIEKLEELSKHVHESDRKLKANEQEKKALSNQVGLVEGRLQELNNLLLDQNQTIINKMQYVRERYMQHMSRKQTQQSVHERLYDNSRTKRHSTAQKRNDSFHRTTKEIKDSHPQIDDFFRQVEQLLQELMDQEKLLRGENGTIKSQLNEVMQSSEQVRMKLEESHNYNAELQQESDARVAKLHKKCENEIKQIQTSWDKERALSKQYKQNLTDLESQCKLQDVEIDNLKQECEGLRANNQSLNHEFDTLKAVFQQVQEDVEDILQRKSITQNKLCLAYGFAQHIFKLLAQCQALTPQFNEMARLAHFSYYFATISQQIDQQRNTKQKRQHIYNRFKKVKNAIRFIKYLKQSNEQKSKTSNKDLQRLLEIHDGIQITFAQSDSMDSLIEKYLPFYHQVSNSEQEQLMIDHKLSLELYQELIRTLFIRTNDSNLHSHPIYNVAKLTSKDQQLIQQLVTQRSYYEEQLGQLQSRVQQLDQYIRQLQEEMLKQNQQEQRLANENSELRGLLKQPLQTPQNSTFVDQQSYSPQLQASQLRNQFSQEPALGLSNTLQQELVDILSRKSAAISNTAVSQSRLGLSSEKKSFGRIVKQP